jgi:hypothetical protein
VLAHRPRISYSIMLSIVFCELASQKVTVIKTAAYTANVGMNYPAASHSRDVQYDSPGH